ncbi:MAG: hypothetical protein WA192_16290 [Candidatus Acidiferrales bacterium]
MRLRPESKAWKFLALLLFALPACAAYGQETVFDVPSADVLDAGKVYGEIDGTVPPVNPMATFTPRVVVGIGHGIEVGVNFDGLSAPSLGQLEVSPAVKWRLWKSETAGCSFLVGDDLFFPVRERSYDAGNYVYAAFAKQWKHGTRVSLGAYDFTRNVVANANRAGGQFTFEQQVNERLTLAAEWYTGKQADGYVNSGAMIKLSRKLTLYAAYQVGNSGVTTGNHQFPWEFGYNFN